MLKLPEEGVEVQGRGDGRQGGALSHPHAGRELQGQIVIPGITGTLIHQIRPKGCNHFWCKSLLFQDGEKDIVIDGGKKLSKVKSDHTCFELDAPCCPDDVSEEAAPARN
jgi:hypothetical protein